MLAITHPDPWDIAALTSVLERYSVGAVLYHGQANEGDEFTKIMGQLAAAKTPVITVKAGHRVAFDDGVTIETLHPPSIPEAADGLADHVLTLRIRYGEAAFLLTSDLSREGQRILLQSGADLSAAVLQLPQHGGERSLDPVFLAAAQPQVALLQVDAANLRGDPDEDTLRMAGEYVEEEHIFRTDEMGAIEIATDGATLTIAGQG